MKDQLILIVDDEPDICGEFSIFVSKLGYRVLTASNGHDALDIYKKDRPTVVLTDYKMPEMNGLDLFKSIKSIDKDVQVIFISGAADMKTAVEAMREDAFDFIAKPVDLKELKVSIGRAVEKSRRKREISYVTKTGAIAHQVIDSEKPVSVIYINTPLDEFGKKIVNSEIKSFYFNNFLQKRICISLSNVNYINNIGLNLLLSEQKDLQAKGFIVVFTMLSEPVFSYLSMLGYLEQFTIKQDYDDAMDYLKKSD